jgi:hypothetical protein
MLKNEKGENVVEFPAFGPINCGTDEQQEDCERAGVVAAIKILKPVDWCPDDGDLQPLVAAILTASRVAQRACHERAKELDIVHHSDGFDLVPTAMLCACDTWTPWYTPDNLHPRSVLAMPLTAFALAYALHEDAITFAVRLDEMQLSGTMDAAAESLWFRRALLRPVKPKATP